MKQRIRNWFKKYFTYSYEEVTRTVSGRQRIQVALNDVEKGKGHVREVTKFRWPWQHPDTHRRGIVLLLPGEYRESIIVSQNYTAIHGSAHLTSEIVLPKDAKEIIKIVGNRFIGIKGIVLR